MDCFRNGNKHPFTISLSSSKFQLSRAKGERERCSGDEWCTGGGQPPPLQPSTRGVESVVSIECKGLAWERGTGGLFSSSLT